MEYKDEQKDALELYGLTADGPNEPETHGVTMHTPTKQEGQAKVSILKKRSISRKNYSLSSPDERKIALSKFYLFY